MGCTKCTTLCFQSCVLFFRNEHVQSTPSGLKLMFRVVSRDSVAERYPLRSQVPGCIQCTTLCFQRCVLFFRNEHAQSTPLVLKTHVPCGFARFRCRNVPVAKSGAGVHTMHHFVLPKLRHVFPQRTCPIHSFRPKTHVPGGFA